MRYARGLGGFALAVIPTILAAQSGAGGDVVSFEVLQPELFGIPEGQALAWADYDGDGDLDLAMGFRRQPFRLYRYEDGRFEDVSAILGFDTGGLDTRSLAWGDVDLDGRPDLYVGFGRGGTAGNHLYRNVGDRFVEIATEVGASAEATAMASARQVTWLDYDGDGDSDLFIAVRWGANQMLRNDGGRFVDVSAQTGLADPRRAVGAAWLDFDRDGDLDLFVANQSGDRDGFYRNDGGRFTDVAGALGLDRPGRALEDGSVGVSVCDFDLDGSFDLYVPSYGEDALYLGSEDGSFREAGAAWGIDAGDSSVASDCGDYDNDGLVDLYVTAYRSGEVFGHDRLFRNVGGGFQSVSPPGLDQADGDHGVRWADFDGDGDLDLAMTNRNAASYVLRNESHADALGGSISLLVLDEGGRHVLQGAEVRVFEAGGGRLIASALVDTGGGYVSQNLMPLHIGLGPVDRVDIEVTWPAAGERRAHRVEGISASTVRKPLVIRFGDAG